MRIVSLSFVLVLAGCAHAPEPIGESLLPASTTPGGLPPGIPVTTSRDCPRKRACYIVEVLDIHTSASSEDKGFDELRKRAIAESADGVVGAEFEHGDKGGPSHLSGVIVKYSSLPPPHEDLGVIDIPSNEDDQDKGLAALNARAQEMGGDQVIDVTFEHGDDGAQGHLRGKVIRYTR
jgi:uncharacterized protein YbjQ (UPF0145 family)